MTEAAGGTVPTPAATALRGLCPRCGAKSVFVGPTKFADHCPGCGLDFTGFNVGDGPAAFLTLILGAIVVALAVTLQLTLSPPLWLQLVIWIPVTAAGVVLALRLAKGALLALEYRNAAREGRIRSGE